MGQSIWGAFIRGQFSQGLISYNIEVKMLIFSLFFPISLVPVGEIDNEEEGMEAGQAVGNGEDVDEQGNYWF